MAIIGADFIVGETVFGRLKRIFVVVSGKLQMPIIMKAVHPEAKTDWIYRGRPYIIISLSSVALQPIKQKKSTIFNCNCRKIKCRLRNIQTLLNCDLKAKSQGRILILFDLIAMNFRLLDIIC